MPGAFSELPTDIRLPFTYTEFDPTQADRGLSEMPFNVLLVGQMLPSGTAEPLTPLRPTTEAQGRELFGRGSQLAQMIAAFLKANSFTKMTAIGVEDDEESGVAATGSVTFSGAVSRAVPLCLYVGGSLVRVGTAVGSSATAVATAVAAAINANLDLAVTASAEDGTVTLTSKHKGECGNDIDIRFSYREEDFPSGLDAVITAMTGGAANPLPGPILAAMSGQRYHMIAWPWADATNLAALGAELNDRWGPLRQIDGQAVLSKTGTFAQVTTFTSSLNNRHLTVLPNEGSPTLTWVDSAASTAILAYYGASDPARPFQTLTIPGLLAPAVRARWSDFPEKNQALFEGCSVRMVTPAGDVAFSNVITTYRVNEWGAETQAYLQLNSVLTLSYLRYDWNNYMQSKYPRYKLASDDQAKLVNPAQPIMTPSLAKAEAIARMNEWVRAGLVEAPEDFANKLRVERNADNPNRLDFFMSPDIVNQFRVSATLISFLL
jgi:phage tail sheath gpL-like